MVKKISKSCKASGDNQLISGYLNSLHNTSKRAVMCQHWTHASSTGPVLAHASSTGPVLAHNGMELESLSK